MDTNSGVQTARELELGASESQGRDRIYVNLRCGEIGQTSDKQIEGFTLKQTKNKSGTVFTFYARTWHHLTGFVNDIKWHEHTLPDGAVLTGWNIEIDTSKDGTFVLGVSTKDRPYARLMNCLLSVDFSKPVMFQAFMGKNPKTQQPQKVLLLSQGLGADNKPIWVQPQIEEKWLSRAIIDKLKAKLELTEQDERNVSRMKDNSFNKDYPYIVQRANGDWSFDVWEDFLFEQMKERVIPEVKAAAELRGKISPPPVVQEEDIPNGDHPQTSPSAEDDDIPF